MQMSNGRGMAAVAGTVPRQHGAMEYSHAPTDLDAVRRYRLDRLRREMRRCDIAGLLLFDQINTRYATDATNMQVWSSHYECRCVFIALDGPVVLFDYANHPHLADGLPTVDEYRVMSPFYYFAAGPHAEDRARRFASEIADLMHRHGAGNNRLAIDRLSHLGTDALRTHQLHLLDALPITEHARALKSAEEVVLMKASLRVCEAGCKAMQDALFPGITENALWALLHETNIRLGGEWIETRLLSSGPRTNPWFQECGHRVIRAGELIAFDTDLIGPFGYCADISRTFFCGPGRATERQRRHYALAVEQIQHNMARIRPGVSFRELTEISWKIPDAYVANRYSSLVHGVGLCDEWPKVVHRVDAARSAYDGVFESNMTVCVESYIGEAGGPDGVKLEQQV